MLLGTSSAGETSCGVILSRPARDLGHRPGLRPSQAEAPDSSRLHSLAVHLEELPEARGGGSRGPTLAGLVSVRELQHAGAQLPVLARQARPLTCVGLHTATSRGAQAAGCSQQKVSRSQMRQSP